MQTSDKQNPGFFLISLALTAALPAFAQDEDTATPIYEQVEVPAETAADAAAPLFGMDALPTDDEATEQGNKTAQEKLDEAHQRFLYYFDDENYELALVAAEQAVILARSVHGDQSLEAGLALANLATVQSRLANYGDALTNYSASVFLIESTEGNISPRLVNPLLGLAATHNALGEFDRGLLVYQRALRINHVEQGLYNNDQMKIRDGLTESYVGLDEMEDAEDQQEVQELIVREKHADELEILMPAIVKLADWYRRTNQPMKEQQQYQRAINTVRQAEGDTIAQQIEALRGLAAAYSRSSQYSVSIRVLKQAYRMNAERTAPDPILGAAILVELGDTYNIFDSRRDAQRSYVSAWQLLSESGDYDDEIQRFFGQPVAIRMGSLPDIYPDNSKMQDKALTDPDAFEPGYMNLSFDVSETGQVENLQVVESDPPNMLDKKVKRYVARYIYRPRMANGAPVNTENVQLGHAFRFSKDVFVEETFEETSQRLNYPGDLIRPEAND
jgi:tetratricopeptide (TPR) repeat protein